MAPGCLCFHCRKEIKDKDIDVYLNIYDPKTGKGKVVIYHRKCFEYLTGKDYVEDIIKNGQDY
jgi:hypothetical protein